MVAGKHFAEAAHPSQEHQPAERVRQPELFRRRLEHMGERFRHGSQQAGGDQERGQAPPQRRVGMVIGRGLHAFPARDRAGACRQQRDDDVHAVDDDQHDRHLHRQIPSALGRAQVKDRRHDETEGTDHQHRSADAQPPGIKLLFAVAHAAGDQRHPHAEQQIREDCSGKRGLHDRGQPVGKGDPADDQFGQIVERGIEKPAHGRPEFRRQPFRGVANQPYQRQNCRQRVQNTSAGSASFHANPKASGTAASSQKRFMPGHCSRRARPPQLPRSTPCRRAAPVTRSFHRCP